MKMRPMKFFQININVNQQIQVKHSKFHYTYLIENKTGILSFRKYIDLTHHEIFIKEVLSGKVISTL